MLDLRPARPADLDLVIAMLEEAAAWHVARGIDLWQPGDFEARRERIATELDRGEYHLASVAGMPVGMFRLIWSDPFIWGELPGDAGYVHRLVVGREFAGKGYGLQLIGAAEAMVRDAGRTIVRLDCAGYVERLVRYYVEAGFEKVERKEIVANGAAFDVQLFEKRLEPAL